MDLPLRYDITIPQRATFRERIQLPIDCSDREVVAQVWKARNGKRVGTAPQLTFAIDWVDRSAPIETTADGVTSTVMYGDFYLVADWEETALLEQPAQWDLLLVNGSSLERAGERSYWLEGLVKLNPGLSAALESG